MKSISAVGYLFMVSALLLLIARDSVLAMGPLTGAAQLGAVALMVWARITFGRRSFHAAANPTEGGVVTTGPYRYVRHPIYAAVLYFVVAAVAAHPSVENASSILLVAAGIGIRIAAEERMLLQRYPEYAEYACRTKRLIPFIL